MKPADPPMSRPNTIHLLTKTMQYGWTFLTACLFLLFIILNLYKKRKMISLYVCWPSMLQRIICNQRSVCLKKQSCTGLSLANAGTLLVPYLEICSASKQWCHSKYLASYFWCKTAVLTSLVWVWIDTQQARNCTNEMYLCAVLKEARGHARLCSESQFKLCFCLSVPHFNIKQ